jgi:fructose PTS system EIIBC or EIIC component
MITIRETLLPEHILLAMPAKSRAAAVQELAETLRSDTRISDRQEFLRALDKCEATGKINLQCGLALRHVRTSALNSMVMAFGRLTDQLQEKDGPLQFLVLVGIPLAMDADYLRLVGALMRVFRNEKLRQKMLQAQSPAEVIQLFETGEAAL